MISRMIYNEHLKQDFKIRQMQRYWALYDDRMGSDCLVFSAWSEREVLDYYIENNLKPSWDELGLCEEFNVEHTDELKNDKFNKDVYDSMESERILSGELSKLI